jgi:hypothetical protein
VDALGIEPGPEAPKNVVYTLARGRRRASSIAQRSAPPSATKKSWTIAAAFMRR